jgi:MFS family permease
VPPVCCLCAVLQLMFVGAFVGSGLFGWACDRWGRRLPLFLATALVAAAVLASLAAPSYWVMAALRAVTGIGAAGQAHCIFLLSTEPVGPDFRCAGFAGLPACMECFSVCLRMCAAVLSRVPATGIMPGRLATRHGVGVSTSTFKTVVVRVVLLAGASHPSLLWCCSR